MYLNEGDRADEDIYDGFKLKKNTFRRHGAKGSYLTLVRVADRIL